MSSYRVTPFSGSTGDVAALFDYLRDQLGAIEKATAAIPRIPTLTAAPGKPRDGMLVIADGTNWNPGSGAGVYAFCSGSWRFLG